MNKKKAIVALLKETHSQILFDFCKQNPDVIVVVPEDFFYKSLMDKCTNKLVVLKKVNTHHLDPEQQVAFSALASKSKAAFQTYIDAKNGVLDQYKTEILNDFLSYLHLSLPETIGYTDQLNSLLLAHDVELIIFNDASFGSTKIIAEWARTRGIKRLYIDHGLALGCFKDTIYQHLNLNKHPMADKFALYSPRAIDSYTSVGISPDQLAVIGSTYMTAYKDMTLSKKSVIKKIFCNKYKISANLPIVSFGTTWFSGFSASSDCEVYINSLSLFLNACDSLVKVGLNFTPIIKDRPQNHAFAEAIQTLLLDFEKNNGLKVIYINSDTTNLVIASDVLVGVNSTMLVEAMLAKTIAINIITLNSLLTSGDLFDAWSGVIEVENHKELSMIVKDILINEDLKNIIINEQVTGLNKGYFPDGLFVSRPESQLLKLIESFT